MNAKSERKASLWDGIPVELRQMCLQTVRGGRYKQTRRALGYLIDHMADCDSYSTGATPYDVMRWIDVFFETCLFPIEFYEDEWDSNLDSISKLLHRFKELLNRVAPQDIEHSHRTPNDDCLGLGIVGMAHRLDVYFAVYHMKAGDWNAFESDLVRVCDVTKHNVEYMLSCENAEQYASQDDWAEFHYPGMDSWEPLNWLEKEYISEKKAMETYVKIYEKYVFFLKGLKEMTMNQEACKHLYSHAEERLRSCVNAILFMIEDELTDGEVDTEELLEEKEMYEGMMKACKERMRFPGDTNGAISPYESGCEPTLHREWKAFTERLRTLMIENPTLPVVVPFLASRGSELDCSVSYVHDKETGDFTEKIIGIYVRKDGDSIQSPDLPFF